MTYFIGEIQRNFHSVGVALVSHLLVALFSLIKTHIVSLLFFFSDFFGCIPMWVSIRDNKRGSFNFLQKGISAKLNYLFFGGGNEDD